MMGIDQGGLIMPVYRRPITRSSLLGREWEAPDLEGGK